MRRFVAAALEVATRAAMGGTAGLFALAGWLALACWWEDRAVKIGGIAKELHFAATNAFGVHPLEALLGAVALGALVFAGGPVAWRAVEGGKG